MTILSSQNIANLSANKALDYIRENKQSLKTTYSATRKGSKIHSIQSYGDDFYAEWNLEDKVLVIVNLSPSTNKDIITLGKHYRVQALINSDFYNETDNEITKIRNKIKESNALKLILKHSKNHDKPTAKKCEFLNNQNESNTNKALIIHDRYTNFKWVILENDINSGIAYCFANLNNNDFAEFGSVRFSDISESFGLSSKSDDNWLSTTIYHPYKNKTLSFEEITKLGTNY